MSLITDAQVRQFHEQGYFVTEPAFDPQELAAVAAEFDRLHTECTAEAEARSDARLIRIARDRPFIGQVHRRSDVVARFARAPIYLEACAKLIGPDADLYYNQAVIKPPERGMHFPWHQDSGYHLTRPLEYITCWTAISRSFIANGCIWVVPGSHQQGLVPHVENAETRSKDAVADESQAIPVEMQAGQVAIFSSLLLHKSGANTSSEIRCGYVPQYHHAGVIGLPEEKPWGDQVAVLRGGKAVEERN